MSSELEGNYFKHKAPGRTQKTIRNHQEDEKTLQKKMIHPIHLISFFCYPIYIM
jgi:hypothetical protein